jgi:hypothetical protein
MIDEIAEGDKVVFLKGARAGQIATVVSAAGRDDYFEVRFSREERGRSRVCYRHEEFLVFPLPTVPAWLCPLSIDDLNSLENAIIACVRNAVGDNQPPSAMLIAKALAITTWHRRLPVCGRLLYNTLESHGFREEWRDEFSLLFDFAVDVLTATHGRPSIKRKAVHAMSIGRYVSKRSREDWLTMFGFDPTDSPFDLPSHIEL